MLQAILLHTAALSRKKAGYMQSIAGGRARGANLLPGDTSLDASGVAMLRRNATCYVLRDYNLQGLRMPTLLLASARWPA